MSFLKKFGNDAGGLEERTGLGKVAEGEELEEALKNFRSSIHAWSAAAYARPRTALVAAPPKRVWRLAAGWALGCALVAGAVSGGLYQRHHQQKMARTAVARQAEQQRAAAEQRTREEEDLLAKVDSDVSREVPSALEPLAQLMTKDETQ
jgi:ribosomal protein L12E/L44/L45/RPP1/RPP2